jgi:N-acetyl-gamma-glutamyl-phosphate reductase
VEKWKSGEVEKWGEGEGKGFGREGKSGLIIDTIHDPIMIKTAIIGGGGYTAGELLRILLRHPAAEVSYIHSESGQGKPVSEVHEDLVGECDLEFSGEVHFDVDVIFLCTGHGKSADFFNMHEVPRDVLVVDLSQDYRLDPGFVYGLPELNREAIRSSKRISNPGCFATAIQLALLPPAQSQLLTKEVHVHAVTGSTGAGQSPQPTTHFSWRNNNLSIYKPFEHQHLAEIRRSLLQLQPGFRQALNFIPLRGDFARGIFADLYTTTDLAEEDAYRLYEEFYAQAPFVTVSRRNLNLKQVVNTNKCLLYLEKHGDKLLIVSIIDNLLKGASGQAVQNMNIAMGIEETTGLWLKGTGF